MRVRIYTTTTCPFCVSAKALLARHAIETDEVDISDDDAREAFVTQTNFRTVPAIFETDDDGVPICFIGGLEAMQRVLKERE